VRLRAYVCVCVFAWLTLSASVSVCVCARVNLLKLPHVCKVGCPVCYWIATITSWLATLVDFFVFKAHKNKEPFQLET